ncbi:MAG TPA: hypothetical protein VLS89_18895, partial [Candidatus Nanopelagicales bacterium]|nr:hypothetical protein [Candidatus Nanopelagicales bacterium]
AHAPRPAARCFGGAGAGGLVGPARSLTIVRLDNGEVLRSFRGDPAEGPPGLAGRVSPAPFDAPITGAPVAYPSQPGQIADRIYVGDADGALWRIDVASPDPTQWTAALAWDAYSLPGDGPAVGQPIDTPPIVSVGPLGDPVILLSTGDQQAFTASGDLDTRLFALSESREGSAVRVSGLWHRQFTGGARVTGPISLFDGVAYFATFTPSTGGAAQCNDGLGAIWALDWLTGGPRLPSAADPTVLVEREDQAPGTVVFGVAVTQTPPCYEEATVASPWLGPIRLLQGIAAARFQLVYHTGAAGPDDEQGAKTRSTTRALPPLPSGASLGSWASVMD